MGGSVSLVNGHIDDDTAKMAPREAIENINNILDSPYLYDESIDYQLTTDDIECLEMSKQALERQIPKKPKHIHEEYEKHQWKRDKYGNIDEWAVSGGFCNGPMCERCYHSTCMHCNPDYDNESCVVDKDLCPNCSKKLSGWDKYKYCPDCGQALDWSDTE